MPDRPQSAPPSPPPPIDLSSATEATRRALYDAVVEIHFNPSPEEIAKAKKNDDWYQKHTAEECDLALVRVLGRWFAYWRVWEDIDSGSGKARTDVAYHGYAPDRSFSTLRSIVSSIRRLSRRYSSSFSWRFTGSRSRRRLSL
jgi:hypothetical protein